MQKKLKCYALTRFSMASAGLSVLLFFLLTLTVLRGNTKEPGQMIIVSYALISLLSFLAYETYNHHAEIHCKKTITRLIAKKVSQYREKIDTVGRLRHFIRDLKL